MSLLSQIANNPKIKKPVIYGLKGLTLSEKEKNFFSTSNPIGFILFARNIKNKEQVKALVNSLKELMEGEALILIDQEGGRVSRLKGRDWQKYPPMSDFVKIYQENKDQARRSCYDNAVLISNDLKELGINVNCAPVLDILTDKTHDIIGNRAFGNNPTQVGDLARQMCQAFMDNDIYPVIKHIPGHGKATCDSHLKLPTVNCSLEELESNDFVPFSQLADIKFAMTAHILYSKIDDQLPATISKKVIDIIRNKIGFQNILMSDDLSMKALPGSFSYRTNALFEAGCDLALHCNSNMKEMREIDQKLPEISDKLKEKLIK